MTTREMLTEASEVLRMLLPEVPVRSTTRPWIARGTRLVYDMQQRIAEGTPADKGGAA